MHITVTLYWSRWRLKSPASWLFAQPFVQMHIKEKNHSSASLVFVRGIYRWQVDSPHKVTRKMFSFHNVFMIPKCILHYLGYFVEASIHWVLRCLTTKSRETVWLRTRIIVSHWNLKKYLDRIADKAGIKFQSDSIPVYCSSEIS